MVDKDTDDFSVDQKTYDFVTALAEELMPLLHLSNAVLVVEKELEGELSKKERSNLKEAAEKFDAELGEKCLEVCNAFVDEWQPDRSVTVQQFFNMQLDMMKQSLDDQAQKVAIEHLRARLIDTLDKETAKSPIRRKLERHSWWIVSLVVIAGFLGGKWYWLVDVSAPLESAHGIVQRAETFQKVIDYDDNMDTRVRKGGWAKVILFWPIKPTDEEITFAGEFLYTSTGIYVAAKEQQLLCGASYNLNLEDDEISDNEIAVATTVMEFAATADYQAFENSTLLVLQALQVSYPCDS